MGVISKDDRVIKLYYSSKASVGQKTLGYLQASLKDLLAIDVTKTKVTGTQWKEFAENLEINISDLIDKKELDFTSHNDTKVELSETDWIKVLNNNPEVLTNPVVIIGDKHYLINNPSEIEKLLEPNSKAINEKKTL